MDKGTMIRTAVLVVALINQGLVLAGFTPLPFASEDVEMVIAGIFTVIASGMAWWKNNNVTKKAIANERFLKAKGLK